MLRILALCQCFLICLTVQAAEPKLTPHERAQAIQLLRDSEKEFLAAVEKISDAAWNYKPALNRWSVGQVAEHIMLTEGLLFERMEAALATKPNPDWESKTAAKSDFLQSVLPNRDRKAQAPEMIRPRGDLTRAEIMRRFKEARARTLKFVTQTDLPMKAHTLDHPFPVFGTLNAYQWLIYIPLHHIRHNQQIAEVKASPGFPQ